MLQRVITGAALIVVLAIALACGGWIFAIMAMTAFCIAMYEEFRALDKAGHRSVWWPTFLTMAASIPLVVIFSSAAILPLMMAASLMVILAVVFRENPKLEDILVSLMPMLTILLPGMCMMSLLVIQPKALQVTLLSLSFLIAVFGDTAAYFVGTKIGGRKLCPAVSPGKTVSGAIGGLVGSMAGALIVGGVAALWAPDSLAFLPSGWALLLLGLVGGIAGQAGDLFASLIKRHCGVKDFGSLFPGHGGMLDRLDSILFTAVAVFCFHLVGIV